MTQTQTVEPGRETRGFQAEVKELLNLMIHSLYSNREIFLRELISNASDACDKLRFEAINRPALFESDPELVIRVDYDESARTITISDNGVGMNRDEVIANLGTIAKSGTREFFSQLTGDQQQDAHRLFLQPQSHLQVLQSGTRRVAQRVEQLELDCRANCLKEYVTRNYRIDALGRPAQHVAFDEQSRIELHPFGEIHAVLHAV